MQRRRGERAKVKPDDCCPLGLDGPAVLSLVGQRPRFPLASVVRSTGDLGKHAFGVTRRCPGDFGEANVFIRAIGTNELGDLNRHALAWY